MKWGLKILPNKENDQAKQELKILEEDIVAAHNFLRKNRHNFFAGKKKIPIYLILGPSRFGKTTILSQAGIDLIDFDSQPLNKVTPTKYCSFWFAKNALYIDTAGTYTKPDITKPRNDLIWQGFVKLLQKYFGKDSIAGTIIILDLPAISLDKHLLKTTLFCIRERIYEMAAFIKSLPTHIIFTKCDRILGFTNFFSLLDPEERLQPFGIVFPNNKKIDLIPTFETKFNELLKQLNNRIIENLQKSIDPELRPLIKIFPSQLEQLRSTFIEVIGKIPNSRQILLSGIYFTSSIQDGTPIDPIKATLLQSLNLKEKPTYNLEANNDRSYFVETIFKKTIHLPTTQKPQRYKSLVWPKLPFEYLYAFLIVGLIIGVSSLIGYQSYAKNIAAINQMTLALQTQNTGDPNSLYTIIDHLEKNSQSWWLTLGINKAKRLHNSLLKAHHALFTQSLISQIENYLNTFISKQNPVDYQKLYRSLQVYLMLGNPRKLEPNYVKSWLNEYLAKTYNDDKQNNNLQQQLIMTLQHQFKIELNQQLIAALRDNLNNSPPPQLIFMLLENSYINQNLNIDHTRSIAKMYTSENFYKIYNTSIPHFINNLPKEDWVLGDLKLPKKINTDETIKNVKELYLEQYAAAWHNLIKIEPKIELKDFQETTKYLQAISSADSSLINLIKQIKNNVNISNAPTKFTQIINSKLLGLNTIDLTELQKTLDDLANHFATIAKNPDSNKMAYITLTEYLQNKSSDNPFAVIKKLANNQPPLLQTYTLAIATNAWQALLNAAYNHINQAWEQTIVPKYKETLVNKYPLFKESRDDISLADFNKFFGPHGSIDSFFNQYIKPLVNTDKTNWTWKNIDGRKLNFSQNSLEIFLRAALIQKMFYADKSLNPKLQFTLAPVNMTPHTQNFSISIDGQKLSFNHEEKKSTDLVWPGPQPGSVTINFVDNQGKYFTTSEFGSWAWFKTLDKAMVTSNNSTRVFELTFDLNGNAARYTLATRESVNPFIPEIISNFRCPDVLN